MSIIVTQSDIDNINELEKYISLKKQTQSNITKLNENNTEILRIHKILSMENIMKMSDQEIVNNLNSMY